MANEVEIPDDITKERNSCVYVGPHELSNVIKVENKFLNVIHFNIRGILTNFDNLLIFLQTYNLVYCDVIVLSETHFLRSIEYFNIPGYNLYYNSANFNSWDGVMIYTKSSLNPTFTNHKFEKSGITLTSCKLTVQNTNLNIHTLYRSPSSNLPFFLDDLEQYLGAIHYGDVDILVGDININILKGEDYNVNKYLALMSSKGFVALCREVTREASFSSLDHIFLKEKHKIKTKNEYFSNRTRSYRSSSSYAPYFQ